MVECKFELIGFNQKGLNAEREVVTFVSFQICKNNDGAHVVVAPP